MSSPTASGPPPPPLTTDTFPIFYPERAESLYGLSIALCILTTGVLAMRFWSRRLLLKHRFAGDDWLALLAWPLVVGTAICGALAMRHGFGVHIGVIFVTSPPAIANILKITYVGELTWVVGLGLIRSSAMLFYNRVFSYGGNGFRKWVIVGVVANFLWSTTLGLVVILQCLPVAAYWDKTITDAKCLSTLDIQLGSGITSIALDLYTLILPMPIIWKLQMGQTKKILTFATFILGYCVIITTIGRTVTVFQTGNELAEDFTYYFPNILYWVIIELSVAHICISLPSVFMLCQRARRYGLRSLLSSKNLTTLVDSKKKSAGSDGTGQGSNKAMPGSRYNDKSITVETSITQMEGDHSSHSSQV